MRTLELLHISLYPSRYIHRFSTIKANEIIALFLYHFIALSAAL